MLIRQKKIKIKTVFVVMSYRQYRQKFSSYQLSKCVIFADGNTCVSAAGTFPEKAGRTDR